VRGIRVGVVGVELQRKEAKSGAEGLEGGRKQRVRVRRRTEEYGVVRCEAEGDELWRGMGAVVCGKRQKPQILSGWVSEPD
jgi:hypothetical protein